MAAQGSTDSQVINFDSDEDTVDIDVPSIETTEMGTSCYRSYRCEIETDGCRSSAVVDNSF